MARAKRKPKDMGDIELVEEVSSTLDLIERISDGEDNGFAGMFKSCGRVYSLCDEVRRRLDDDGLDPHPALSDIAERLDKLHDGQRAPVEQLIGELTGLHPSRPPKFGM